MEPDVKETFALSDVYPAAEEVERVCIKDKPKGFGYGGASDVGKMGFFVGVMSDLSGRSGIGSFMQFGDGSTMAVPVNVSDPGGHPGAPTPAPSNSTCVGGHQRSAAGGACL